MPPRQRPSNGVVAVVGPDGVARHPEHESRLNEMFAAWLASPVGVECMGHLRHITIEAAGGPGISNDELRHREGQRFLVAYISQRKLLHEKAQRDAYTARTRQRDANSGDADPA